MSKQVLSWLLRGNFVLLAIQNAVLGIGSLLVDRSQPALESSQIIRIAFYLDIIGFVALFVLGLFAVVQIDETDRRVNWILIALGSIIFVYFSLIWRTTLDIYPQINLDFLTIGGLVPNEPQEQGLDAIRLVIEALRFSNLGLLLVSIGLFGEHNGPGRYAVLFYGVANFIIVMIGSIIILFKFLLTYIAIPYFAYISLPGKLQLLENNL